MGRSEFIFFFYLYLTKIVFQRTDERLRGIACQYFDGFAKIQQNWKTNIRASMPMYISLSISLFIHIVLYPYSNHILQEINSSPCIVQIP